MELFPYGTRDGDQMITGEDDKLSDEYHLSKKVDYFGEPVSYVRVSVNGYIAMGNDFSDYTPDPLTKHALVAPFFTDVDTRPIGKAGAVYFREERDPRLLDKAEKEILDAGLSHNFRPTILFIGTWSAVGYYSKNTDKWNTFQAVIASNGNQTYVLMYYSRIMWTSPDNMNGESGLLKGNDTTKLPILGIGDGQGREHRVCEQNENMILKLPSTMGNSRKKGLWIFVASEKDNSQPRSQPRVEPAGDRLGLEADCLAINDNLPFTLLYKNMVTSSVFKADSDHLVTDFAELGFLVSVPKDAAEHDLTLESRVAFGGPYFVDKLYEPISPIYLIKEITPSQNLNKGITFEVEHEAKLTAEDKENVVFVSFSPDLGENNTYACRIIDSSQARFQISNRVGKLTVKNIGDLRFRLAKKVRKSKEEFRFKKEFCWKGKASNVAVSGTFNDWGKKPLKKNGIFSTTIDLPIGSYQYKFIVDLNWMHDPSIHSVPDGQGGLNNLVEVTEADLEEHNKLLTQEQMKQMRFVSSFYNTRIKQGRDLVPFSLYSVYSDHTIHHEKAQAMMKYTVKDIEDVPGLWSVVPECALGVTSEGVEITASEIDGWDLIQSHVPAKILREDLWTLAKKLDTSEKPKVFRHPIIKNTFVKAHRQDVELSQKATLGAKGFTREVGTQILLLQDYAPLTPGFLENLKKIMMRMQNAQQVTNFGIALGVKTFKMKAMEAKYRVFEEESSDNLIGYTMDLHDYIKKNSMTLHCNREEVHQALINIKCVDLAKEVETMPST